MTMSKNIDRISIQVGLSGYSFKLWEGGLEQFRSGWMPAEKIFTTKELQKRYDAVDVAVFTPKATLVPEHFYNPGLIRDILDEVVDISDEDVIEAVPVPQFASVMVYSNSIGATLPKVISETVRRTDGTVQKPLPELYYMLSQLSSIPDYNKMLASYMDGVLYLVIAQGKSLLLCNSFQAQDFTTAEYFIFLSMKKLQLNPEVTTICFRTALSEEEEMSLYRYFKSVEKL